MSLFTSVSRRRKKKKRLRRDARLGLSRGNQRADFGSPRSLAILMKPRDPPFVFPKRVSRRRGKKKRLRRDARLGLSRGKWNEVLHREHRGKMGNGIGTIKNATKSTKCVGAPHWERRTLVRPVCDIYARSAFRRSNRSTFRLSRFSYSLRAAVRTLFFKSC